MIDHRNYFVRDCILLVDLWSNSLSLENAVLSLLFITQKAVQTLNANTYMPEANKSNVQHFYWHFFCKTPFMIMLSIAVAAGLNLVIFMFPMDKTWKSKNLNFNTFQKTISGRKAKCIAILHSWKITEHPRRLYIYQLSDFLQSLQICRGCMKRLRNFKKW